MDSSNHEHGVGDTRGDWSLYLGVLILGVYFERTALVGLEIAIPEPMRRCCRGLLATPQYSQNNLITVCCQTTDQTSHAAAAWPRSYLKYISHAKMPLSRLKERWIRRGSSAAEHSESSHAVCSLLSSCI